MSPCSEEVIEDVIEGAEADSPHESEPASGVTRREFLAGSGLLSAGVALGVPKLAHAEEAGQRRGGRAQHGPDHAFDQ